MATDGLEGTLLTKTMVETAMREGYPQLNLRLGSVESKLIGVGKGFVSNVVRLAVTWTGDDSGVVPKRMVAKIPAVQAVSKIFADVIRDDTPEESKKMYDEEGLGALLPMLHGKECSIYDVFEQIPSGLPVPTIFKAQPITPNNIGFILMEDLSDDMSLPTLKNGFNLAQLEIIFDALADLSAYSIEKKDTWSKIVMPFPDELLNGFHDLIKGGMDTLIAQSPALFEGKSDWVVPFCKADAIRAIEQRCEEQGQPRVIVHGDLHGFNVLFNKDGTRLRALIDWQGSHPGFAVEDMGRILTVSADAELRRCATGKLLARYLGRLAKRLPGHPLPTQSQLAAALGAQWPSSVAAVVAIVPSFLLPASPALADLTAEDKTASIEAILARTRAAIDDCAPERRMTWML